MHIWRNFSLICACLAVNADCSSKRMAITKTGNTPASRAPAYQSDVNPGPVAAPCIGCAANHLALATIQTTGTVWKARLFSGIPAPNSSMKGDKVTLRPTPATIHCEFEKRADYDIPLSGVQEITHEMTDQNLGGNIYAAIKEGYRNNTCANDCVYGLAIAGLLAPFHLRAHYVTLAWSDGSDVRSAVFRLGKRDYRAFMEAASAASGQPYRDLAEERAAHRRELRRQLKNAAAVRLDHNVALGGVVLKRRVYKMLVTEDPVAGSVFVLYVGEKAAVEMPVYVVTDGHATSPEVAYAQSPEGEWTIAEIRIQGKILRFSSAGGPSPQRDSSEATPPDREP